MPVAAGAFDRVTYGQQVFACSLFMGVDLALSSIADSCHWLASDGFFGSGVFAGDPLLEQLFPNIVILIGLVTARVVTTATLYHMVVRTRAFKLGMWTAVSRAFKRTLFFALGTFVLGAVIAIVRALGAILGYNGVPFPSQGSIGGFYYFLLIIYLPTTALYFIAALDALRKVAQPRFHLHPDRLAAALRARAF